VLIENQAVTKSFGWCRAAQAKSDLGECSAEYTDNALGSKVESGSTFSTDGSKAQLKYAKNTPENGNLAKFLTEF